MITTRTKSRNFAAPPHCLLETEDGLFRLYPPSSISLCEPRTLTLIAVDPRPPRENNSQPHTYAPAASCIRLSPSSPPHSIENPESSPREGENAGKRIMRGWEQGRDILRPVKDDCARTWGHLQPR